MGSERDALAFAEVGPVLVRRNAFRPRRALL